MKQVSKIIIAFFLVGTILYASCKKVDNEKNNPAINKPPVANAGTDKTIVSPVNSATLDGSNSTDPENAIIHYLWSKIAGPVSSKFYNANVALTTVTNLVTGVYQFELKVTDAGGLFSTDTVVIVVKDSELPIADAGPDQTISLPLDSTWLDGSSSSPNGWSASTGDSFLWTKISGPSQFELSQVVFPQATVYNPTTAIARKLVPGIYYFKLLVTNALGKSIADTVQINVVDDPLNSNTVTYHHLFWQQGDVYGLGAVDIFLNTSIRPDIFFGNTGYRPIEVYLKLDASTSWISVPFRTNALYTYDKFPLLLWIINYPNNPLLVGKKSEIRIKLL
jgi:hypothetical protein